MQVSLEPLLLHAYNLHCFCGFIAWMKASVPKKYPDAILTLKKKTLERY